MAFTFHGAGPLTCAVLVICIACGEVPNEYGHGVGDTIGPPLFNASRQFLSDSWELRNGLPAVVTGCANNEASAAEMRLLIVEWEHGATALPLTKPCATFSFIAASCADSIYAMLVASAFCSQVFTCAAVVGLKGLPLALTRLQALNSVKSDAVISAWPFLFPQNPIVRPPLDAVQ